MKYIFLSLLFLSCAHKPEVQYNDPETTKMEAHRRSLLVGKWQSQNSLLELAESGEYLEKDLQGKVRSQGIWGIKGGIYFVLSKQNPSLYRNHQIIELNQREFSFKDPKTAEIFLFKRLQE